MIFINRTAGCNFPANPVCKQIAADCWGSASAHDCLLVQGDSMPTSCYTISSARELLPKPASNFAGEQSWFHIGETVFSMLVMCFFFVPWEHLNKITLPSPLCKSHCGCCWLGSWDL